MLAVRGGSKHITTAVLAAGGRLEAGREVTTGRNIFHIAANTTASVIGQNNPHNFRTKIVVFLIVLVVPKLVVYPTKIGGSPAPLHFDADPVS